MSHRSTLAVIAVFAAIVGPAPATGQQAQGKEMPQVAAEKLPVFDKAYLSNGANIKLGEKVWTEQCRHCHGNSAYPGKAPKLNPGSLDAAVIFDRVTNGFRKMPAWKEVFSLEERKGVVAYVKSDSFSP